jgi:mRNA-degrading endonuclease toxin of MazEF toxin-antitoxin module
MILRGEVYWYDFPSKARPVVVVSCDEMNESRIASCIVASITSTPQRADRPGWVLIDDESVDGVVRGSVNASTLNTVLKSELREKVAALTPAQMLAVDDAITFALFGTAPR